MSIAEAQQGRRNEISPPQLSIVIPVLNEAENIPWVLEEIESTLVPKIRFELIFVDDGSNDETVNILVQGRDRFPQLNLLRHDRVYGKSTAMVTGAQHANAPWIGTMDGDGQNDPEDLWKLYSAATAPKAPENLLLVAGQRLKREDTRLKQISSRVANGIRMRLSGDPTPDAACGLKVFRRDAFLSLPRFENMHRFLSALFRRQGGQVLSVPVVDRPRRHGQSKFGLHNRLWVGIADLLGIMWLQRRPLFPAKLNHEAENP